jgi:hypothetical protein
MLGFVSMYVAYAFGYLEHHQTTMTGGPQEQTPVDVVNGHNP